MTLIDLQALLPLIILSASAVVVLLVSAFHRNHRLALYLTLISLGLSFVSLFFISPTPARQITPLFIIDSYGVYYIGLLLLASMIIAILSYHYIDGIEVEKEEYYVLILLATLGSAILVVSNHFASFFLGLEILSVGLYVLVAYTHGVKTRVEAAIKYLILASASAAFLLFGMALIYAEVGTMNFSQMALTAAGTSQLNLILMTGFGMLIVGMGFKLAVVPFQLWTPDVYQGAPVPVTAFIATVSKGGMFALLLRYFNAISFHQNSTLWILFAIIAAASILVGNVMAVMQNNVKRILAYSSIAHLGYLLVAFLASGPIAARAVAFYLVAYFITILCAFGVVTVISTSKNEAEDLSGYIGLFWRNPWLGIILTASLFSLAGIPPTAGIIGKIYIAAAGVSSALWFLLIVLVIGSIIGVFYYLRIITAVFHREETGEPLPALPIYNNPGRLALTILIVFLVGLGIYPVPLLQIIDKLIIGL